MSLRISRTDEVASVLLVLLAGGIFLVSRDFPSGVAGTPGPAFFPRVIAGAIAVLAVVQLVDTVVTREADERTVTMNDVVRFVVPAAFLVGYILLLPMAGFLLTTVAFLVALMYYSGARDLRVTVPLSVVIGVILQNVFVGFLHVPLPGGPLGVGRLVSLTMATGGIVG